MMSRCHSEHQFARRGPGGRLKPCGLYWREVAKDPTKLYKHGGISLMECLVPWVETGAAVGPSVR